jgi:hypothetical protein
VPKPVCQHLVYRKSWCDGQEYYRQPFADVSSTGDDFVLKSIEEGVLEHVKAQSEIGFEVGGPMTFIRRPPIHEDPVNVDHNGFDQMLLLSGSLAA